MAVVPLSAHSHGSYRISASVTVNALTRDWEMISGSTSTREARAMAPNGRSPNTRGGRSSPSRRAASTVRRVARDAAALFSSSKASCVGRKSLAKRAAAPPCCPWPSKTQ